jgi:imidazolonepropionase-like amidohydrolase
MKDASPVAGAGGFAFLAGFAIAALWQPRASAGAEASASAGELIIEHVTVVSPERSGAMPDTTVRIRDERIVSVSRSRSSRSESAAARNVEVLDGTGLYLSPGLIDSHLHTHELPGLIPPVEQARPDLARDLRHQMPRSFLYFGFTTIVDAIGTRERLQEWNAHPLRPDMRFCGAAPIPGGYPPTYQSPEEQVKQYPYLLVQKGDEARAPAGVEPSAHTPEAVIARMKKDGALCVKTFYERGFGEVDVWLAPRLDTIQALVKAAHAAKLPVLIHANGSDAQEFALKSGADIIAHGLWHWHGEQQHTQLTPRTKAILDEVIESRRGWQPTMRVLYGQRDVFDPEFLSNPKLAEVVPASALTWYRSQAGQWFREAIAPAMLPKSVLDSGDPARQWDAIRSLQESFILAAPIARNASATGYLAQHGGKLLFATDTPGSPGYPNQPGLNGWLEMNLLLEAGVTPAQIFRSATLVNAEALGLRKELGTVQRGKRANLLLTRADPSQTIQAYDQIVKVIVGGRMIDRSELAANRN